MNSSAAERVHGPSLSFIQWRIQGRSPGDLPPPLLLFLDQNEARRAEKIFWETAPPPPLFKGLDDRPPLLISRSGSWHCYLPPKLLQYVTYVVTLRSRGRAKAGGHKLEQILLLKVH